MSQQPIDNKKLEAATLAAGCFWCTEAAFSIIKGVERITSVEPLKVFYNAETYHKDYYKKHPKEPYCQVVIASKIGKLQQRFFDKIKVPL